MYLLLIGVFFYSAAETDIKYSLNQGQVKIGFGGLTEVLRQCFRFFLRLFTDENIIILLILKLMIINILLNKKTLSELYET